MAHPAIPAPAAGHRHHRGLPPGGIPASVMPGDADGALAAPRHGAATSYRPATRLAAPAVSRRPP